jgi:hypothetical protein
MMRGPRRLVVCAALAGLLAAGTSMVAARADAGSCTASGAKASCKVQETISAPVSITVGVGADSAQNVTVTWTVACFQGAEFGTKTGTSTKPIPLIFDLTLPFTNPTSCAVTVTATLAASGDLNVDVAYQPASSSSPTPAPTPAAGTAHLVSGYGGQCLDDAGNSSANRAKVQIWTCDSSDPAQSWRFTGGELVHNGKCANDRRSGGSGSRVILYTCNHAPNETWTHRSDGEFVLSAKGGVLCLDDPAYSTRNGTQLIVYTCKNSSNQHWSLP